MKKRILSTILLAVITTTGAIVDETKPKVDLKSDYKNTKELMNNAKKNLTVVYKVISDYFQVKTCKENFTAIVSIKEIRKFTTMNQYIVF